MKKRKSSTTKQIWGIISIVCFGLFIASWLINPQAAKEELETASNTLQETYEDAAIEIQTRRGEETGPFGISMGDPVDRYDCHGVYSLPSLKFNFIEKEYMEQEYGSSQEDLFNISMYECPIEEIPRPHPDMSSYYVLANDTFGILAIQGEAYNSDLDQIVSQLKEKYGEWRRQNFWKLNDQADNVIEIFVTTDKGYAGYSPRDHVVVAFKFSDYMDGNKLRNAQRQQGAANRQQGVEAF